MSERISDAAVAGADLPQDYTLSEVATSLKMSTRWLRNKIIEDKLDHQKYGHKIMFTAAQVAEIRERYKAKTAEKSVTTGRKRSK